MELKLYIRQLVLKDKQGNEQHIAGTPPKLLFTPGQLPHYRQFPSYNNYIDITDSVSDLYKLKLTWTIERTAAGLSSVGSVNHKKGASGTITFEGEAYQYMKRWLVDDISALFNILEVKIEDIDCGEYADWVVKATDINWCEGDICTFSVNLKQKDESLTCIKNTWIADDWQGWFGDTNRPLSGLKHPRFSYCNEIRPNGMLITLWWTMTQLMSVLGPLMLVIAPVVNSIVFTLKNIIYPIINTVLDFLGKKKLDPDKLNYIDYKDIKEIFGNFFLESGGCGREHPAP